MENETSISHTHRDIGDRHMCQSSEQMRITKQHTQKIRAENLRANGKVMAIMMAWRMKCSMLEINDDDYKNSSNVTGVAWGSF